MRLLLGFIRAVVAGLAVGGLCVLLAHLAGAAELPSRTDVRMDLAAGGHTAEERGVAKCLRDGHRPLADRRFAQVE